MQNAESPMVTQAIDQATEAACEVLQAQFIGGNYSGIGSQFEEALRLAIEGLLRGMQITEWRKADPHELRTLIE